MGQLYIAQLNVQSIKPKLLELRQDIAEHGYDVVVLCETWLKPSTDNRLIPVPGYQLLRRDRADGRGSCRPGEELVFGDRDGGT